MYEFIKIEKRRKIKILKFIKPKFVFINILKILHNNK